MDINDPKQALVAATIILGAPVANLMGGVSEIKSRPATPGEKISAAALGLRAGDAIEFKFTDPPKNRNIFRVI